MLVYIRCQRWHVIQSAHNCGFGTSDRYPFPICRIDHWWQPGTISAFATLITLFRLIPLLLFHYLFGYEFQRKKTNKGRTRSRRLFPAFASFRSFALHISGFAQVLFHLKSPPSASRSPPFSFCYPASYMVRAMTNTFLFHCPNTSLLATIDHEPYENVIGCQP